MKLAYLLPACALATSVGFAAEPAVKTSEADEAVSYVLEPIPSPAGEVVEASCMEAMPGDRLAVGTRRGDIFVLGNISSPDPAKVTWSVFARGIHEPLGLAWRDGWLWVTQKPEVSRLKDTDGDGRADVFETVSDRWGFRKNDHEFAFGSKPDREGAIWVVLCLTGSFHSEDLFRGWALRVFPDGRTEPAAYGIRSPGGIGADADGELYYTDNQGVWNGSSSLKHLTVGSFQGNPESKRWFDRASAAVMGKVIPDYPDETRIETQRPSLPTFVPPAVVLPHGELGNSPSGVVCDLTGGKFGPFKKQMFVSEQTASQVQRICLEKVRGVTQGACFPFRSGFNSGCIAEAFADNGTLYVGGSNRGWGSKGTKTFAVDRLRYTGVLPFEMDRIAIVPNGFRIDFTEAVGPEAAKVESYAMASWTYIYHAAYGSPKVDQSVPVVKSVAVAADKRSVTLTVDGLVKGNVHQITVPGVRSQSGKPVVHPIGYYTINEFAEAR